MQSPAIQSLRGVFAPAQNTLSTAAPGFRDLLALFLQIETTQRTIDRVQGAGGDGGLISAPLHLDIRIGLSQLMDEDTPLTVQLVETANALVVRIASASGTAGGVPMAEGGAVVGRVIGEFRLDQAESREKLVQTLLEVAQNLLEYLTQLQMLHAFDGSSSDKRRKAEEEARRRAEADKIAIDREIERRRVLIEQALKDVSKRRRNDEDGRRLAQARAWHQRLVHYIDSAARQLAQPSLDPSVLEGMQRECERLNLEVRAALAAQTSARTQALSA